MININFNTRFNGAVDLNPRKRQRTGPCPLNSAKLQWGRGFESTETRLDRPNFPRRAARRFNGAVDLNPRKRCRCRFCSAGETCFNGAVDLNPRKPLGVDQDDPNAGLASMGPWI